MLLLYTYIIYITSVMFHKWPIYGIIYAVLQTNVHLVPLVIKYNIDTLFVFAPMKRNFVQNGFVFYMRFIISTTQLRNNVCFCDF